MIGRPSDFTPETANEICDRLAKGESLRSICADEESGWLPSARTVHRWLASDAEWAAAFRQQYVHAREAQADTLVDEIVDIADGKDKLDQKELEAEVATDTVVVRDHNRDRLRIDARKWVASKLAPKKYGEKLDLAHSGEVGVTVNVVRFGEGK